MYHPTRGGVRGGRDQFSWEDVKVDKHRENYLGHSIKAPVGRWQKGKDLHWYNRDKKAWDSEMEAAREEIKRIKEQEEQAMREALGLAPKRASRAQGNRLDKHEFSELVKRGSTAEDLGAGHAEAAQVQGLGFSRAPRPWEEISSLQPTVEDVSPQAGKVALPDQSPSNNIQEKESDDESSRKKRRREEKKQDKRERREKRHSRDSDDKRKRRKDKGKRRHDSDSD
ncbi:multiple myeloma tumor-associated protein 2 homolog [Juglans microcarpa x Juglans regia]|uniref:multiple myeloma tumor-associated protein 2 homolog n=1 Tax=Juglans microcarpa x Juglans regia TaxID=2249226 RepID=UPI001B7EFD4C|nr:multiple myeloma tumor-associated protein 2 homolog [Juglans microcarpa x Juglans regia]